MTLSTRLRWLTVWAPVVFGALLLTFALTFHHLLPLWLVTLLILGASTVGAYLFSRFVFAQIERREETILRRTKELEALNRIGTAVSSSFALPEILDQALDTTLAVLDFEAGEIFLLDEARGEVVLARHRGLVPEAFREISRFKLGEGFPGRVAQTGEVLITYDLAKDLRFLRRQVIEAGFRTFVSLPLKTRGKMVGTLDVATRQPRVFTEADLRLLTTIGTVIGMAVANGLLFLQAEERAVKLQALLQTTSALHAGLGSEAVVERILQAAGQLFGEETVSTLWLLDEATGALTLRAASGLRHPPERPTLPPGEGLGGWIVTHRQPLAVADVQQDPRFGNPGWAKVEDVHAFLGVPLLLGERCLGVMDLLRRGTTPFTPEEQAILEAFAQQVAIAFEKAQLFQRILKSKEEWVRTVDALPEGIVLLSPEGVMIRSNKTFSELWGISVTEMVGTPWHDLWTRLQGSGPCPHCEVGRTGAPFSVEVASPDRILQVTAFPLEEQGPETEDRRSRSILVLRDITAERWTERLVLLGQLAAGVAHELNTPLSVILGYTQLLLKRDDLTREAAHDLRLVEKHARAARRIVEGLRHLVHPLPLRREVCDVNRLIQDTLAAVEPDWASRKIRLHLSLDPSLPPLFADPLRLGQALRNLIDNAVDAMPQGGTLTITTRGVKGQGEPESLPTPDLVEVTITDTGVGIPPEHLPRIFEPFFTTKPAGLGLGLGFIARIVEEHKGRIEVESQVGQGTTFRLLLPETGDMSREGRD